MDIYIHFLNLSREKLKKTHKLYANVTDASFYITCKI